MFRKHGLLNGNCVAAALLLLAAAQPAVGQRQAGEADVVYRNGSVYTVDAVSSRAQAFATASFSRSGRTIT
jgi:hypothetical protein